MKIAPLARRIRSGFSLVEVTIASGITAIALTTLLGLIPEGLKNVREAGDLAAETRITTHILGTVAQSRWLDGNNQDQLPNQFRNQRYYFDDQGVVIDGEPSPVNLSYVAEVTVPALDVQLSADAASDAEPEGADPYLRRVTVKVASAANPDFNFDRALPIAYRTHTTLIARTGK